MTSAVLGLFRYAVIANPRVVTRPVYMAARVLRSYRSAQLAGLIMSPAVDWLYYRNRACCFETAPPAKKKKKKEKREKRTKENGEVIVSLFDRDRWGKKRKEIGKSLERREDALLISHGEHCFTVQGRRTSERFARGSGLGVARSLKVWIAWSSRFRIFQPAA